MGLEKFRPDLKISEAFLMGLKKSVFRVILLPRSLDFFEVSISNFETWVSQSRIYHSIPLVTVLISKAGHVWVSWPCEEKIGKLGAGNVLVLLNRHGYDRQEATNQWKPKPLLNKPKQELQRNLWTKVSTNITNTTAHEKLMSDNGKRRIFLKWQ